MSFKSVDEKFADVKHSNTVLSNVQEMSKQTILGVLEVAETLPLTGPFAKILKLGILICNQYKCNKVAFEQLKARLYRFAEISFGDEGILNIAEKRPNNITLKPFIDQMVEVLDEAIQEVGVLAKTGFLSTLIKGSKIRRTFNYVDSTITQSLNELSVALQVTQLNEQTQTFDVVCDLQAKIDSLGGLQAMNNDSSMLECFANEIGCTVADLKIELKDTLNRIDNTVQSVSEKTDTIINQNNEMKSQLQNLNINNNLVTESNVILNEIADRLRKQVTTNVVETLFVNDPPREDFYDDRSVLGHGAFGVTYRMRNSMDNGLYALKEISLRKANEAGVTKDVLLREATILQQLNHPSIVRYFTCFYSRNDTLFSVVMELVTGGTIAKKIKDESVTLNDIVKWFNQLASTLCYMHYDMKIQHRDIKPENILLSNVGNIKVIDLGLASMVQSSAAKMTKVGTSTYYSYEKANDIVYDGRDDVWAAGCVMAELITKTRLLERGGAIYMFHNASVNDRRLKLITDCESVDAGFGGVIRRMLEPEQSNRCNSKDLVKMLTLVGMKLPKDPGAVSPLNGVKSKVEAIEKVAKKTVEVILKPITFRKSNMLPNKVDSIKLVNKADWKVSQIFENITGSGFVSDFKCCFNPEGNRLITYVYKSAIKKSEVKLWDIESGEELLTYESDLWVDFAAVSGDEIVVVSGNELRLFDCELQVMSTIISSTEINYLLTDIKVTPDGGKACSLHNDKNIKVWDLIEKKLSRVIPTIGAIWSIDMDISGDLIASGHGSDSNNAIKLWDALSGGLLREFVGHKDFVNVVKFSHNASRIVSGSSDSSVSIWDVQSAMMLFKLVDHVNAIKDVCWNCSDCMVLSASKDGTVKLWNSDSGVLIQCLEVVGPGSGNINGMSFVGMSEDCASIVTRGGDNVIRKWT